MVENPELRKAYEDFEDVNAGDTANQKFYVLTRTNPLKHAWGRSVLRDLSHSAKNAHNILSRYGIEIGPTITASLDEARYGPFPDLFSENPKFFEVSPELKEELKKAGFYLEGPFDDGMSAVHFWNTGEKEEAH